MKIVGKVLVGAVLLPVLVIASGVMLFGMMWTADHAGIDPLWGFAITLALLGGTWGTLAL
jgi:hypothetical protein